MFLYISKLLQGRRGTIMITAGSLIVIFSLLGAITGLSSSRAQAIRIYKKNLAQIYATELIELFRSRTGVEIANYLGQFNNYPLCAHMNILNRSNNTIENPDPNVDLGSNQLDIDITNKRANRFYIVQVIDVNNLQPNSQKCGQSGYSLSDNERFLITVGVSYYPTQESTTVERVVLSTIIPE